MDGQRTYIDGGIKSYKHYGWTYSICCKPWWKCRRCKIKWTNPNTHQPYICLRRSSKPVQRSGFTNKQIRFGNSGHCLDSPHRHDHGEVHLWRCRQDNRNQRWDYVNGELRLHGTNLCLDNSFDRAKNGNKLVIHKCFGKNNGAQKWVFSNINGVGTIKNGGHSDYCVDLYYGVIKSGHTIHLWKCSGNTNQRWRVSSSSTLPLSTAIRGKLHIANVGDREFANSGWMGYTGIASRVEGLAMSLPGMSDNFCRLKYMVHVATKGDTAWVSENAYAGTKGKGLAIEGLRIRLEGSCQGSWGIRYKCHLANVGDTAWARDGAYCGTTGQGRPLEAFQVQMYRK